MEENNQLNPQNGDDQVEDKKDNNEVKDTEVKTYTEDEVKKMVQDRIAREKKATEKAVEEAKKLAKMNEEEKQKYEFEKLQKELEDYKRKDSFNGLAKEATKMLSDHQIIADEDLLTLVVKDSAEDTQAAVNSFVKLVNSKVEEGVKKALSGKPPKVTTTSNALTKEQIMQEKDTFKRQKLLEENIHLFRK